MEEERSPEVIKTSALTSDFGLSWLGHGGEVGLVWRLDAGTSPGLLQPQWRPVLSRETAALLSARLMMRRCSRSPVRTSSSVPACDPAQASCGRKSPVVLRKNTFITSSVGPSLSGTPLGECLFFLIRPKSVTRSTWERRRVGNM